MKPIQLYNYINELAGSGWLSVVKDEDGTFYVFGTDRDENGKLRTSGWWGTEERALSHIGFCGGYSKEDFIELAEKDNWQFVRSFRREHKPVKVGRKVKVLENAKEICEKYGWVFLPEKKEMVGKVYEVERSDPNAIKINGWAFPLSAIELLPPDTEEPNLPLSNEELLAEVERRGLTEEGKIIKH